jgi:NADH-quinone oxidoreductase subunit N
MTMDKLPLLYPYLILAAGILTVLLMHMIRSAVRPVMIASWALVFLVIAAVVVIFDKRSGEIWGMFYYDGLTRFILILALCATAITIFLSLRSREVSQLRFAEYTVILLTACIGIALMASAKNLLLAYLAIETVSMSCYILTGFKRQAPYSHEAALKYVIFGSAASGVMVFGMSLLYGMTGGVSFSHIATALSAGGTIAAAGANGILAVFIAVVMVFTGFMFKIAAVPFHMWCPDVYQGAPTPFTGFLSVAPKTAGFALILRFVSQLLSTADATSQTPILVFIGIVSAVTMTLGNFAAIHQVHLKRLLAYSSIAQAGYLLMGVVVMSLAGSEAVLFYLTIYLFMNIGAFAVVQFVVDETERDDLDVYRGLGNRMPFLAVALAIFLFSLAGLPPLAGFIGKFYLFAATIKTGGNWYFGLVVIAAMNSVVALFYYVKIIREMFLRENETVFAVVKNKWRSGLALVLLIPIFILGLFWEPLQSMVTAAATALGLN